MEKTPVVKPESVKPESVKPDPSSSVKPEKATTTYHHRSRSLSPPSPKRARSRSRSLTRGRSTKKHKRSRPSRQPKKWTNKLKEEDKTTFYQLTEEGYKFIHTLAPKERFGSDLKQTLQMVDKCIQTPGDAISLSSLREVLRQSVKFVNTEQGRPGAMKQRQRMIRQLRQNVNAAVHQGLLCILQMK
jgi:hypothetical protein